MIELIRSEQLGFETTIGKLFIDSIFYCDILELKTAKIQNKGHTCIPPSNDYFIRLNTWGGKNTDYEKRFPTIHVGMLEVFPVDGHSLIYIHIGNTKTDTLGCLLCGDKPTIVKNDWTVYDSRDTYVRVYQKIVPLIKGNGGKVPFNVK